MVQFQIFCFKSTALWIKRIFIISFFLAAFCLGGLFFLLEYHWADFSLLWQTKAVQSSVVLDDRGEELFKFERDKRIPILYEQLPIHLVHAFVATEDRDFFDHPGISWRGILRSTLVNLWNRRVVQGASTITQQVVRLLFLTPDRTFLRKVHEVFLALQLERQWTKEQIFEIYVNNIYFGRGIYGVEAACQRFWNKSVLAITYDEAAMLAAIAKSAFYYSPLNSPDQAIKRRNVVLACMRDRGFVTAQICQQAQQKKLWVAQNNQDNGIRQYLKEWIRIWIESMWGRGAPYTMGLKIKTTINKKTQEEAERVFSKKVALLRKSMGPEINGGLLAISPESGAIKASVGGFDFKESEFNRSFKAVRQMGSSFKPILYALGIAQGIDLKTVFVDEPLEFYMKNGKVWKPRNWDNKFRGELSLKDALTCSNNIVSIKLLAEVGIENSINFAKQFGITKSLKPYPSLALGTAEATMEENVGAFNVFANSGFYVKPFLIEKVISKEGRKIWSQRRYKKKILDLWVCEQMVEALAERMRIAKYQLGPSSWLDCDSIGKTGSTNGASSVWFLGATPSLTTAVYIGRDDNKQLGQEVFASKMVFPLWFEFNKAVGSEKKNF